MLRFGSWPKHRRSLSSSTWGNHSMVRLVINALRPYIQGHKISALTVTQGQGHGDMREPKACLQMTPGCLQLLAKTKHRWTVRAHHPVSSERHLVFDIGTSGVTLKPELRTKVGQVGFEFDLL